MIELIKLKPPEARRHPAHRRFKEIARLADAEHHRRRRLQALSGTLIAFAVIGVGAWIFVPVALSIMSHGL